MESPSDSPTPPAAPPATDAKPSMWDGPADELLTLTAARGEWIAFARAVPQEMYEALASEAEDLRADNARLREALAEHEKAHAEVRRLVGDPARSVSVWPNMTAEDIAEQLGHEPKSPAT